MHTAEEQANFAILCGNGWSLAKISDKLQIPKTTLFNWDHSLRPEIRKMNAMQLERLQEKYAPSVEEELQNLFTYLTRVEKALQKRAFDDMRPEFLLKTALYLRARLNKLRSDVPLDVRPEEDALPSLPMGGCLSRSENPIIRRNPQPEADVAQSAVLADIVPSPPSADIPTIQPNHSGGHQQTIMLPLTDHHGDQRPAQIQERIEHADAIPALAASAPLGSISHNGGDHKNGTFPYENSASSGPEPSASATSHDQNGTLASAVPFSDHHPSDQQLAPHQSIN